MARRAVRLWRIWRLVWEVSLFDSVFVVVLRNVSFFLLLMMILTETSWKDEVPQAEYEKAHEAAE